mmetsp:Transcript_62376/g.122510  ORF Transcript_62376/g.122510 Transcript_62376/m.122510 type:complete len:208 (-) Transcript_62376:1769-2392(-)
MIKSANKLGVGWLCAYFEIKTERQLASLALLHKHISRLVLQSSELKLFQVKLLTVGFLQVRDHTFRFDTVLPKRIEVVLEVAAFQKQKEFLFLRLLRWRRSSCWCCLRLWKGLVTALQEGEVHKLRRLCHAVFPVEVSLLEYASCSPLGLVEVALQVLLGLDMQLFKRLDLALVERRLCHRLRCCVRRLCHCPCCFLRRLSDSLIRR